MIPSCMNDQNVLEIRNLKKSYTDPDQGPRAIVNLPEFELKVSQQMALRGASGTGKTTFLHLIAGLLQADQGEVLIQGRDIQALKETERDEFRGHSIGYVFQTFNLLQGLSALENVLVPGLILGQDRTAEAALLLSQVGLGERLNYLPRQLSVGQQQRVSIARALLNSPRLLLADEPTGNLDPQRGAETIDLIRSLCQQKSTALLLISHDTSVLKGFERVGDWEALNQV